MPATPNHATPSTQESETAPAHRVVKLTIVVGAVLLLGIALLAFDPVDKLAVGIIVLALLQGLWRGMSDIAGLFVGTLVALVLAPAIGRGLEGVFASVLGTGGLGNRMLSIGVVGLVIVAGVGAAASFGLRRLIRSRPAWKLYDPYIGAGVGALEGGLLSLAVMWVPVALRPIAQAQVNEGIGGASAFVVKAADAINDSALSGLADATNPVAGSRLVSASNDFLEVLTNRGMHEAFLESEVMREINSMSSVNRALEIIRGDKQLMSTLEGEGATDVAVRALFDSPTVLRAIDETGVMSELSELAPRIESALKEARAHPKEITRARPGGGFSKPKGS